MENQNPQISQIPPTPPTQPQNIPVEQPQPFANPVSPSIDVPKSKFPLAVIIGIILFLLVAGSAAGFYIYKQQSSNIAVKPTPSPIVQKQIPSPTPDPTANWKTYANTQLGFSFKYPQTFETKPSSSTDPNNFDITINSPAEYSNPDQIHISLTVTKNINNVSFADYLKEKYGQPTHPGGNPSFTVEGILKDFKTTNIPLPNSFSYKGNMVKGDLPRTLFSYKDNFYTFVLSGGAGEGAGYSPEAEKIYGQILSTFKFTDQAITPLPVQDIAQIKQLLATLDNTTVDKIVFTQDQQKYSNFVSGGFGQTGVAGGAKWFAAKINNQWKIIFTGNGAIPNCSDIEQYNSPKDFLPCN